MMDIQEIIIHCSCTTANTPVNAEKIKEWHKKAGMPDVGYHFLIERDGAIVDGRPMTMPGEHCPGHNENSIGICYIGGKDAFGMPADTRTPEQMDSLLILVEQLQEMFPGIAVHGHNEYDSKVQCPNFSVRSWLIANELDHE